MPQSLQILLISPDLMSTSKLAGLTRQADGLLETLRSLEDAPRGSHYDVVLLDVQAFADDPAVLVARVLGLLDGLPEKKPPAKLIAFGPHVHKQRLEEAVAAGVDEAVSRGELFGGFPSLIRRWTELPAEN
jgi:DNA-binding NarL/FixJ family response regulator